MTDYAGIDYGLGRSNVDKETGIRYGVISQNSINLDCADWEYDYGKPTCPQCGNPVKDSNDETLFGKGSFMWDGHSEPTEDTEDTPDWFDGKDYTCLDCQACYWSDQVYGDEAIGWTYESDGYKLTDCLDNDIFVLASPFYTFAQFCSPCVPGAGNLDTPVAKSDGGIKTYALGHDWFDGGQAPYKVYRVSDGQEVLPDV